jgi:RimJ/RimL family protein N-acetyltransferase
MTAATPITTARLLLRPFAAADRPAFARLNADPRVMEHFPSPLTAAESDALAARIEAHFAAHGFGLYAVEVPGVCAFGGFIGLAHTTFAAPFTPCVEVGWRLAYDLWGRGYAVEGARAACAFGFATLALPELVSFTAVGNLRSRKVMERLGMRRDPAGAFDHPRVPDGHRLRRHVLYRLRAADLVTTPPARWPPP